MQIAFGRVRRRIALLRTRFTFHLNVDRLIIPFVDNDIALPAFMKCLAMRNKLKVYSTKERFIHRNDIS